MLSATSEFQVDTATARRSTLSSTAITSAASTAATDSTTSASRDEPMVRCGEKSPLSFLVFADKTSSDTWPHALRHDTCSIRFGHTIPVSNHVDVTIVQDENAAITHTWTNFVSASASASASTVVP